MVDKEEIKKIIAIVEELNKNLEERNNKGWVKVND